MYIYITSARGFCIGRNFHDSFNHAITGFYCISQNVILFSRIIIFLYTENITQDSNGVQMWNTLSNVFLLIYHEQGLEYLQI